MHRYSTNRAKRIHNIWDIFASGTFGAQCHILEQTSDTGDRSCSVGQQKALYSKQPRNKTTTKTAKPFNTNIRCDSLNMDTITMCRQGKPDLIGINVSVPPFREPITIPSWLYYAIPKPHFSNLVRCWKETPVWCTSVIIGPETVFKWSLAIKD